MKKQLPYYELGEAVGFSQDWFEDHILHIGGCAAVTACDCCLLLSALHKLTALCPFAPEGADRESYIAFAKKVKPYLHPGVRGVDTLSRFVRGFSHYLRDSGRPMLGFAELEGEEPAQTAYQALRRQIINDIPVPFLLLKHRDPYLDEEYGWHWFVLAGFDDDAPGGPAVWAVTYGEGEWLDFERLWHTGYAKKGGLILLSLPKEGTAAR